MRPGALPSRAGLSLLELLVAIAIVAMMVGVAALSLNFGRDETRRSLDHLATQLRRADLEAAASGRFTGLRISALGDGYDFLTHAGGAWRPIRNHPSLEAESLPDGLVLRLESDPAFRAEAVTSDTWPDIWFDPTGITDPFTLRAETATRHFRIERDAAGDLLVVEEGGS